MKKIPEFKLNMSITKGQHNELKKQFEAVTLLLKVGNISAEDRRKLETIRLQIAGVLMSQWLPINGVRKTLMLIIALVTLYFFIQGSYIITIISFIILCIFSPRIVGEVAVVIGRAKGN